MRLLGNLLVLLLAGCAPHGTERVVVAGSRYCVPSDRLITAPHWIPSGGTIKDEGLALRGCYWRKSSTNCRSLVSVGSLSIYPKATHAFTRYHALQPDAFYRTITLEPDTSVRLLPSGLIEIANTRLYWGTLYWKLSGTDQSSARLPSGEDELVFACEEKGAIYSCSRIFNTGPLSVSYGFSTSDPANFDVLAQDHEIIAELERLKCDAA